MLTYRRKAYIRYLANQLIKDVTNSTPQFFLEQIEVTIKYAYLDPVSKDAIMCSTKQGLLIIVNTNFKNSNRIRFTLAHELGHIILGHFNNNEQFCKRMIGENIFYLGETKELEEEANYFASNFLMPSELLHNLYFTDELYICYLSEICSVSPQAAEIRINNFYKEEIGLNRSIQ